jgi:hypothetical protein
MSPEQASEYGIIDAVYSAQGDSLIAQAHDAGLVGGGGSDGTGGSESAGGPKRSPKGEKGE